ncbi:UPF0175 family protein [Lusitaniella coriacea]|uniref:UPF0175 family protein n=1 Tax=Lusitaniella coriacea TaxID=1983105 RepID=UPI003CF5A8E0
MRWIGFAIAPKREKMLRCSYHAELKTMSVVIPNKILQAAQLSEAELRLELAIFLFEKYQISTGKARRLAGMSLIEFRQELAKRGICVHYDLEDLHADIETLQKLEQL